MNGITANDFEVYVPPKIVNRDTYTIKLNFKDELLIKDIFDNSTKLKDFTSAKIFINTDKPYHTRKDGNRLRKKKYEFGQLHPDDDIKIEKGKLYHNGTIIDKFDLNNQFFY